MSVIFLFRKDRENMSKKINSAKTVKELEALFKCPFCSCPVQVLNLKSLVCSNNHTFDFAKQGYLNLMTHSAKSQYSKELFAARHQIIRESNMYSDVHTAIISVIKKYICGDGNPFMIADLGCGEGSHLQSILEGCTHPRLTGVGLDISKEGILMSSKKYEDPIWLVGDLVHSPFMNDSFQVLLNILSPSNYKEFKRIAAPGGLVIKVVPSAYYLKEIRESLFPDTSNKQYKNDEIISLFKNNFHLLEVVHIQDTKKISKKELENLVYMTPLAWTADKKQIEAFIDQDNAQITIDLEILIGLN